MKHLFIAVLVCVSVFASAGTLYADFWDTEEKVVIEDIIRSRYHLRSEYSEDLLGNRFSGKVHLTIVGFDIEYNQSAIDMLHEMSEAVIESGARSSVLFAGQEDEKELELAMIQAVRLARGYLSGSFDQITVSSIKDMFSFDASVREEDLQSFSRQTSQHVIDKIEGLFRR